MTLNNKTSILGIDPGIANTGWAIIEIDKQNSKNIEIKDVSLIKTLADEDIGIRIKTITTELTEKIKLVDIVAVEKIFFHSRISSTLTTAYVIGSILYQSSYQNKIISEIRPQQAKIALGLKSTASKAHVGRKIEAMFKKTYNQHTADAIAIAIAGNLYHKK